MTDRATDEQLAEWERRAESIGELFPFVEDLVEALKAERVRAGKAEAANYSTLHEQEIIHLHEQLATTKAQLKAVTEYHGCPAGAHMDDTGRADRRQRIRIRCRDMSKRTSNGKISKWRNYFHEYDDRRIEPIDDMLDAIHDERDRADKAEARLDKVLQLAVDLENGRDLVGPQTRTGDLIAAAIREAIA